MYNPTFKDDDSADPAVLGLDSHQREQTNAIRLDALENNNGDLYAAEGGKTTFEMPRKLGLMSGIALIVGNIIGSGIFVSSGGILRHTDSVGVSLVIWAACGVFSLLGALVYADLGTMIPKSGAEYAYFLDAWGAKHAFFGPLPAFLYSWISVLLLRPSIIAIMVLSFAQYTVGPIAEAINPAYTHGDEYAQTKDIVIKSVATLCLVVVTVINCFSSKLATKVQNVFTAAKLVAMVIIIAGGIYYIAGVDSSLFVDNFQCQVSPNTSFGNIGTAFYSGVFAYDGWNNLNLVTEELKNPNVNLFRSIIIGLPMVTIAFLLVNIAYLTALAPAIIKETVDVANAWGRQVLGPVWFLMPLAVAISSFGGANGWIFSGGRLNYVAAREGHLPGILSCIHMKYLTPVPGLLFSALVTLLMVLVGNLMDLINLFAFLVLIFYGMAMAVHIMMCCSPQARQVPRPVPVSVVVSIIFLLFCVFLVVAPIVQDPQWAYLYVMLFFVAGVVVYAPCVYYISNFPPCCERGTNHITSFLQRVLGVAPCSSE